MKKIFEKVHSMHNLKDLSQIDQTSMINAIFQKLDHVY